MRKIGLACILVLSLLIAPSFALDPNKLITQYDLRVYTAKDGLPMNSVKKVFQDSRGYIWVGTQEGLVRFDGAEFRLYDKSRYPGLRSNFIWDIAEDRAGNLWLATQGGGISRFDGTQFTSYDTADGLANNVVNQIIMAEDGSLLIATENGLSRFKEGASPATVSPTAPTPMTSAPCCRIRRATFSWGAPITGCRSLPRRISKERSRGRDSLWADLAPPAPHSCVPTAATFGTILRSADCVLGRSSPALFQAFSCA